MDGRDTSADVGCSLEPQDAELFDRLVDVQFDLNALTDLDASTRARAERLTAMMGLLEDYPVEPMSTDQRSLLVSATLARINREEELQQDRMRIDSGGRLPRLRLREFVAIAAVLLMAVAIVFPMMKSTNQLDSMKGAQANLMGIYEALGGYQASHDGESPSAVADDPGYQQVLGYSPTMLDVQGLDDFGVSKEMLINPMMPEALKQGFSFHSQRQPLKIRFKPNSRVVIVSGQNTLLQKILQGQQIQSAGLNLKTIVLRSDGSIEEICPDEPTDHIWDCDQHRLHGPTVDEIFLIHGRTRPDQPQAGQQGP
ncbi:MAG: hypothetical protein CMJ39_04420 [Phycisphaerae bacterium]|nr:hypothetical protein [Phycisphaerae bacterium]